MRGDFNNKTKRTKEKAQGDQDRKDKKNNTQCKERIQQRQSVRLKS